MRIFLSRRPAATNHPHTQAICQKPNEEGRYCSDNSDTKHPVGLAHVLRSAIGRMLAFRQVLLGVERGRY